MSEAPGARRQALESPEAQSPKPKALSIQFYHLTATPLERALPKLLEKALGAGFRCAVVDESESRIEHLNNWLWTYDPGSFLPHGTVADGNAELQPILLVTPSYFSPRLRGEQGGDERNLLLTTSGYITDTPEGFSRILDMFDGTDPQAVEAARGRWKAYKEAGHDMAYMRQTDKGGWEKAA